MHNTLVKWRKEKGNICTIWLFNRPVIVVSGYDAIREVLITKSTDFAGRMFNYRLAYFSNFRPELTFEDYSEKQMHAKKHVMNTLKMYGEGMQKLEDITMDILDDLIEEFDGLGGNAIDPLYYFRKATMNIMASMVRHFIYSFI